MKKCLTRILALCLILALCGGGSGAALAAVKTASEALREVENLIADGRLYDAALACSDGLDDFPSSESDFQKLWDKIADACKKDLPKTGELVRTFRFQGGNELRLKAVSGHAEMTVRDVDSDDFARVFVREGESTTVYLPAGEYEIGYKIGDIWFGDKVGFGDFCESYSYSDTLLIKYTASGGWVTYYYYEFEL